MEQDIERLAGYLKLPRESRERIRLRLAAYQTEREDVSMKKTALKSRIPLIAAVAVMAVAFTTTAAAVAVRSFRNDIIISGVEDIPEPSGGAGESSSAGVASPNGDPPVPLEEVTASCRLKSADWAIGEEIDGGITLQYGQWDSVEVLSSDPALRSRRVSREDGAEKMEYTAENPASLLEVLTGRVTWELSWLDSQYDYVPDANFYFVVTGADGDYVQEVFLALYEKGDGSGYVQLEIYNMAQEDYTAQSYIIDGSYETAYYYTAAGGYEFLVRMDNGNVWADCRTGHASISLYGAYLTEEELEAILDNLCLSVAE